jgi:hypothetical protein
MKKLLVLTLAFILAACSVAAPSEYDQNLKKWNDANLTHYRFKLSLICFCVFTDQMPLTVEVQDGEVVSVTNQAGETVLPSDDLYQYYEPYLTVDRLFAELGVVLSGEAEEVLVTYDSTYGYPIDVSIDYIKEAIDDELYIQISDLEVLK